jgi:hypothetical protein
MLDMNQISAYKSESILTSKRASIEANAQEIHHRTMFHAIHQKIIDMNRLVRENRIFDSDSLCDKAMIKGIHSNTRGMART